MRHYRRNADTRIRDLERAASSGDPEARTRLLFERVRVGELRIASLWFAAVIGDQAAARAVGWRPVEWVEPTAYVFAFLDSGSRHLLASEHYGSFKRVRVPWPKITARQRHTFATAFAWACATSVRGIAITGLRLLVASAANAADVPDGWDDWARDPSWRDLVRDNVEDMIAAARACALGGKRNLRTLSRRIRASWGGDTPRDIHYMIQGLHRWGDEDVVDLPVDLPAVAALNHAAWENSEAWRDMFQGLVTPYDDLAGEMPLATYVAGLAGYMSAFSSVRACVSRIGSGSHWSLGIPISGWFRDGGMEKIAGNYSDAVGFASDAYTYAAQAWSILESGTVNDPEGQIAIRAPILHALIRPLLEARL